MEHSLSSETSSHAAGQGISCLLWNPVAHYCVCKNVETKSDITDI